MTISFDFKKSKGFLSSTVFLVFASLVDFSPCLSKVVFDVKILDVSFIVCDGGSNSIRGFLLNENKVYFPDYSFEAGVEVG